MLRSISQRLLGGLGSAISHSSSLSHSAAAAAAAVQPPLVAAEAGIPRARGLLCSQWGAGVQQFVMGCIPGPKQLHTSAGSMGAPAASAAPVQLPRHFLRLDRLQPAPGSSQLAKRWGRGNASDRGKTCGRGTKGQKARKGGKPHLLFDGGQKTLTKFPKVWVTASSPVLFKQVRLSKVLRWVQLGLLDPHQVVTMKDLRDSGCAPKTIRWGVELVANGTEQVKVPLHLAVSSVSPTAQSVVEAAGGSVTRVYYTQLGLRALLKPENFQKRGRMLPRAVRAWPPRENGKYDVIGQLPPLRELPSSSAIATAHSDN